MNMSGKSICKDGVGKGTNFGNVYLVPTFLPHGCEEVIEGEPLSIVEHIRIITDTFTPNVTLI